MQLTSGPHVCGEHYLCGALCKMTSIQAASTFNSCTATLLSVFVLLITDCMSDLYRAAAIVKTIVFPYTRYICPTDYTVNVLHCSLL